jgi:hypothetical protein
MYNLWDNWNILGLVFRLFFEPYKKFQPFNFTAISPYVSRGEHMLRDSDIAKKKITLFAVAVLMSIFSISSVPSFICAAEKVVVIPLFASCKSTENLIPPIRSGQERCTAPTGGTWAWVDCSDAEPPGQDGQLQLGRDWPDPHFTDNGDGTVSDNLTGLVWLQNADCLEKAVAWFDALTFAVALHDGWTEDPEGGDCGLADGSLPGDWRIPTIRELLSIINYNYYNPALSDAAGTAQWTTGSPFVGVEAKNYWTSTNYADGAASAWDVHLKSGDNGVSKKAVPQYAWPVRDGS